MALTRRFLNALGIEDDKIEEIINAHSETVTALKEERDAAKKEAESFKSDSDNYKAETEKVKSLQKEVEELKKAAEEAEKQNGENAWKLKYDAIKEERDQLRTDFDTFKNETTAKETKAAKEKACRKLFAKIGIPEKRMEGVLKYTNLDTIDLDEEGNVVDSDNVEQSFKDEWADIIPTVSETGATTPTPPANTGGGRMTREQIDAIEDTGERQKAMLENRDLYGI